MAEKSVENRTNPDTADPFPSTPTESDTSTSNDAVLTDLLRKLESESRSLEVESSRQSSETRLATDSRNEMAGKLKSLKQLNDELNERVKITYNEIKTGRDSIQRMKEYGPMLGRHEKLMQAQIEQRQDKNNKRWAKWREVIHSSKQEKENYVQKWESLPWVGPLLHTQTRLTAVTARIDEICKRKQYTSNRLQQLQQTLSAKREQKAGQLLLQLAEMLVRRAFIRDKVRKERKRTKYIQRKLNAHTSGAQDSNHNDVHMADVNVAEQGGEMQPCPLVSRVSNASQASMDDQANCDEPMLEQQPAELTRVISDPRVVQLQREAAAFSTPKPVSPSPVAVQSAPLPSTPCVRMSVVGQPLPSAMHRTPTPLHRQVHFPEPVVSRAKTMTPSPMSSISSDYSPGPSASQRGSPVTSDDECTRQSSPVRIQAQRSDASSVASSHGNVDVERIGEIGGKRGSVSGGSTQELLDQSFDAEPVHTQDPLINTTAKQKAPAEMMGKVAGTPRTDAGTGPVPTQGDSESGSGSRSPSPTFLLPGENTSGNSQESPSKQPHHNFLAMFGFGRHSPSPERAGVSGFSFFGESTEHEDDNASNDGPLSLFAM